MKNLFKRITSSITALAMTFSLCNGIQFTSFAEEAVINTVISDQIQFAADDYGLSDDELLLGYFENKLYGFDGGISTFAVVNPDRFTGNRKILHDELKNAATIIAAGNSASATVTCELTWIPSDAGYESFTEENVDSALTLLDSNLNSGEIMSYLLAECPYEFYWFDKKEGMIREASASYTDSSLTATYTINFSVGKEYAGNDAYTVNTTATKSASAAAANAKSIVDVNKGKSDLARLTAYKEKICELVSYDTVAAENIGTSGYDVDPWQVIHVFDGNTTTNVVCEGYAKAFQYLCDIDGGLTCYSVSGTMSGGTGAGGHMWNIVTLGGANYLVDLTNCDGDSNSMAIGYPDMLFLKGMTENTKAAVYSKNINNQTITFTYYDGTTANTNNMTALFGADILTLSTTDYSEVKTVSSISVSTEPTKTDYNVGDTFEADGLSLKVMYSDGTNETVEYSDTNSSEFTFAPTTMDENTTSVAVTYGEKSTTVPVTVNKLVPAVDVLSAFIDGAGSIYASTPINEIKFNFMSDVDGDVAFADSVEYLTAGNNDYPVVFTPADSGYASVETTVRINAMEGIFSNIEIKTPPTKTSYVEGENFDPSGLVITATYENSTRTKDFSYDELYALYGDNNDFVFSVDPDFEADIPQWNGELMDIKTYELTAEDDTVSVGFAFCTDTLSITVSEDVIDSIEVARYDVASYNAFEAFDPTGLEISVTYKSGKKETVAYSGNESKFNFSPETLKVTDSEVTITYDGKTTTVPVSVSPVFPAVQVSYDSSVKYYDSIKSEDIPLTADVEGTAVFRSGQTLKAGQLNDLEWTFTPADTTNYKGVTGVLRVYIYADTLNSISIDTKPANTTYTYGDTFDPTGLIINAGYASGTKKITYGKENKNDFSFSPETLAVSDKAVTVTYGGKTTTIPVTVKKRTLTPEYNGETTFKYGIYTNITCATKDGENYISEGKAAFRFVKNGVTEFECVGKAETGEGYTHCTDISYYLDSRNEIDAGVYELYFQFEGNDNYEAFDYVKIADITIEKVVPEVTVTASSDKILYTSSKTSDVTLTASAANTAVTPSIEVTGTTEFDGAIEFKVGTNNYPVLFTPDDKNYDPVRTTVTISIAEDTLEDISVTTDPTKFKVEYTEGDMIDTDGLVVTAEYASGATKVIDNSLLTFTPEFLSKGNTSVTVIYNEKTAVIDGLTVRGRLTADNFIFTAPANLIYDGATKEATIEAAGNVTGVGAITVSYYEGSTNLNGKPTDAGTYTVRIDVSENDNYTAVTGLTSDNWTFTIDKATPVIAPKVTGPDVIYDITNMSEITFDSGVDVEGTLAFDGETKLEVGTNDYNVIFRPNDSKNYNDVKGNVSITVIENAVVGIEVMLEPDKKAYTYGEQFDPTGLTLTAVHHNGDKGIVPYKGNESEITFTPEVLTVGTTEITVGYDGFTTKISGITVAQATPEYNAPTNLKATYGDTLADIEASLPTGWSWDNNLTSVGDAGIKTFPATYTVADPNYKDVTVNLGVVVSPKTISISGVTVNNKNYDGTTNAVVSTVTFNNVINDDNVDYTATAVFADKNAGADKSVTVVVTVSSKNYTLDSDTITTTATINKINPDTTIPTTVSAITDQPLSSVKLPDNWAWDNVAVIPVNGQKYGATYTPADTTNYNTLTAQITVTVSDCTHPETTDDIKDSTCTEDGIKTTICDSCDKTVSTEIIPAGHKWNNDYTVDIEATCTTDGEKSVHCKNCTEIKPDSAVAIPAAHKWNERYSSNSTSHWIKCTNCDETQKHGSHSYGYTLNSKKYCSVCGNSYGTADDVHVQKPDAGTIYPSYTAPKPAEPQIMDKAGSSGWNVISDELKSAEDDDMVSVDMNGTTKLPESILTDIAGRNVELVLDMGSGITWTINGETVTDPRAVDLRVSKNVKRIPADILSTVTNDNFSTEISLAHNGDFGFEATLTISLGKKYNNCYANLYYYNPKEKVMEFIDSDLISKGEAQLIFNHASDYVIVIDEETHGDDVSSAAGITADNNAIDDTPTSVSVEFVLPILIVAGLVLRKKLCR
ncbi:MAG: bacterial Ig-like domain-containing protein [Oscillospiraceae bacterium]|nr:bacterial Ig-like domain-containing protein [Oscillospiraceae bacterium]